MLLSPWRRLVKQTLASSRQDRRRPQSLHLHCESLEPRCQPSAFVFSTGIPDGRIATIGEPPNAHNSNVEFESADDFIVPTDTVITHASFTGLLTGGATLQDVSNVFITIYRVFPNDSDLTRTPNVPTRMNSPADNEIENRDSAVGELNFHTHVLSTGFTAQNSVSSADKISVNSGGNSPVTGVEVEFDVTFRNHPLDLPADHYFFVPKVGLSAGAPTDAHFLWLSVPRPIVPPGTPFTGDLQSWMRDDPGLAPDWLRIGADIIGGTTFNASFALKGHTPGGAAAPKAAAKDSPDLAHAKIGSSFSSLLDEPSTSSLDAGTERGLLKAQPLLSTDNGAAVTAVFSQTDSTETVSLSRKSASAHGQSSVETALSDEGTASASMESLTSV
jgi:hypothetical protein